MIYSALAHMLALLLDLFALLRRSDQAKDLEILALRQQLHILQRSQPTARPTRGEKRFLAVLTAQLRRVAIRTGRPWQHSLLLFTPATILRWHRAVVRRTWTFTDRPRRGRPRTPTETEALILRLARENAHWVCLANLSRST